MGAGTATKQDRKLLLASQKQDRLLYLCTYLRLNLAEDPAIERKMHKKVSPQLSCSRMQAPPLLAAQCCILNLCLWLVATAQQG